MFSQTSGRSILALSTEPRSPPVQVATWTSTPSATYLRRGRGALARLVVGVGVDVHESEAGAGPVCGGLGHGLESRRRHLRFCA